MTCRFLEDFSFAKLLHPLSEKAFLATNWDSTPIVVRRNNPEFYGDLLTLEDCDHEIANDPHSIKTAEGKSKKNRSYQGTSSEGTLETILADMRSGSTLVLDVMQRRLPNLGRLCRMLSQELGHRYQTNLYLTPPHGKGFTPHWDNHDVFILQVMGFKHWKVEKTRRKWPARMEQMAEEEGRVISSDAESFTLEQGDMIYIPRGFVHAAECGDVSSLHITLGFHPFTWEDFLHGVMTATVAGDESLTHPLPLGYMRGNGKALAHRAMAVLKKAADEDCLIAMANAYQNESVMKALLDISGMITNFFRPVPLAARDVVGPRPGIVFRLHANDATVKLHYGGQVFTFQGFFREPLEFALNTESYAIADIPGELEESEKLFFIQRLMQDGLVIVKMHGTVAAVAIHATRASAR